VYRNLRNGNKPSAVTQIHFEYTSLTCRSSLPISMLFVHSLSLRSHVPPLYLVYVSSAGNSNKAFGYSFTASEITVLIELLRDVPICCIYFDNYEFIFRYKFHCRPSETNKSLNFKKGLYCHSGRYS